MPGLLDARAGRPRAGRRLRRQHRRPARRRRTRSASRASSGRPRTARSCSRRWRSSSACCPEMAERGWGRVLAIGSMAVREPIDALQLSNAHRPGLVAAFKVLARRYAADGVTLNFLHPGRIATDRVIGDGTARGGPGRTPATPSRPAASARPRRSPPPPCSSAPRPRPTSRARACSWTAGSRAASELRYPQGESNSRYGRERAAVLTATPWGRGAESRARGAVHERRPLASDDRDVRSTAALRRRTTAAAELRPPRLDLPTVEAVPRCDDDRERQALVTARRSDSRSESKEQADHLRICVGERHLVRALRALGPVQHAAGTMEWTCRERPTFGRDPGRAFALACSNFECRASSVHRSRRSAERECRARDCRLRATGAASSTTCGHRRSPSARPSPASAVTRRSAIRRSEYLAAGLEPAISALTGRRPDH